MFFKDGDTTIGVAPVGADGTAKMTTASLGVGDHQLTAVWSGNLSLPSTTSDPVTVTIVGVADVTLSVTPSTGAEVGDDVTLTAHTSPSSATGTV